MNYDEDWLDRYKNPTYKALIDTTNVSVVENSSCGDLVKMMLLIEGETIKQARFEGTGCVMSTASADMLCEYIESKKIGDVFGLSADSWILRFPDLSPGRYNCVLLALRAMKEILNGSK